ncbi:hypothetical protein EST38_g11795 [Candolleomyces aberdarensis]|uniref:Glutaredoxin domain-containing protein n=1 Tax=Candolleomyces aberdarensis TaxID=2316362 RepID=A0A4V1Q270_9AGAR|nr:hypothetical protein EST38_g11795 [Candolleomyces aberdarensis]
MATVKELVDSTVEKNPIVIFSKSWCPYCKKAKNLLATEFKDVPATIFEYGTTTMLKDKLANPQSSYRLDERDDGSDIQNYLQQKTQQRTVPNVFIKQEHIGGKFPMSGKLAGLLKA